MSCSKEDIERKRLAALEKRLNQNQHPMSSPIATKSLTNSKVKSRFGCEQSQNVYNGQNAFHPYTKRETSATYDKMPVSRVVSGTMYLISENRFEINPSEYCTPLINIFKTIESRSYDFKSKLWNFSIKDYDVVLKKVATLAPHIVLGTIPAYVLKVLKEPKVDLHQIDISPVESTIRNKLMPFQEEGVRFAISHKGRCMIADDMGLGKTFQALAVASYYRHNWPLLIVTTSSMRETWQNKIHELLPSVPMMNIVTLSSGKDTQLVADKQTEVVIVSFKITTMHSDLLKKKKFGFVIIDESHHLKSHKAQCTVSLGSITRGAERMLLLSGTPALSRPNELFTQLSLIHRDLFPSYTDYGKRYCGGKQTNFGWDMSGQSNLAELQLLLQKKFLIRRTKGEVLETLDAKVRETILLDQSLLQFTKADKEGLSTMASDYKNKKSTEKQAALLTFFSESARVKIPAICKYVRQLVSDSATGKFLVFAHHKIMIDAVCNTLDEASVNYICIVGNTPSNTRADLVEKFQHSPSCRCAVLSITAAGSGITLTAAGLVLFAELHWNPGIVTQAESRAHRIGRKGEVCVRYLLAEGTCDTYMWPMLQDKLNVLNDVGLSGDSLENTTTRHQERKMNITQYLSPSTSRNIEDYIPGTNIRKNSINTNNNRFETRPTEMAIEKKEDCDKMFLDDDEGDELLANLDL